MHSPALTGRAARPSSRNRRFARFRRTAVPEPSTDRQSHHGIPLVMPGQIWRLNSPVETRRPFFLMCWISPATLQENGTDICPTAITNLPAGYLTASPGRPERSHVAPLTYDNQVKTAVPTPGRGLTTWMCAYMQIAERQERIRR